MSTSASRAKVRNAMMAAWTILLFLFVFAPIFAMIAFSFNVDRFPAFPWGGTSTIWYEHIFADVSVERGFYNSLLVAGLSASIATMLGFTGAYLDYRFEFTGKGLFFAVASSPPTVPVVILGVAMLTFQGRIGISGTTLGLVAAHVVICAPFAMALIRMRLNDLNKDIEQAAWNLGAGPWVAMREIIVPFCLPAILASLFITASVSFDEFMIAWFVSGQNETLPVRILAMLQGQVSPRINAVGSLVFIASVLLIFAAQLLAFRRKKRIVKDNYNERHDFRA
jgi:spermidine/putrescine transport system permease protein